MQLFRSQGLPAPEPSRGARIGYGAGAWRRYGRLRPRGLATPAEPAPPAPCDDDPLRWVDQQFEEYFFE